jgi:hypothetical protein
MATDWLKKMQYVYVSENNKKWRTGMFSLVNLSRLLKVESENRISIQQRLRQGVESDVCFGSKE